jgi:hypothetical protein
MSEGIVRLQDEEVNWLLSQHPNVFMAAANAAEAIAAYWSKIQDKYIGPLRIIHGQQYDRYIELAVRLRTQANRLTGGGPIFYPANNPNGDYGPNGPVHIFKIGQTDFPGSTIFWPPADLPPLTSYP